ncbi:MAG: hypothetical protein ABEJ05_14090, partial [Haloglomus sp.]
LWRPLALASVPEHAGASAGRSGDPAARWNHHVRTLGATNNRAGLKGAARLAASPPANRLSAPPTIRLDPAPAVSTTANEQRE